MREIADLPGPRRLPALGNALSLRADRMHLTAQRRIAVTALNADHLHRYYAVIRQATERLHRRLAAAARAGESVAIDADFSSYTVDVTSALAFGRDLNTLERGEHELQQDITTIF